MRLHPDRTKALGNGVWICCWAVLLAITCCASRAGASQVDLSAARQLMRETLEAPDATEPLAPWQHQALPLPRDVERGARFAPGSEQWFGMAPTIRVQDWGQVCISFASRLPVSVKPAGSCS